MSECSFSTKKDAARCRPDGSVDEVNALNPARLSSSCAKAVRPGSNECTDAVGERLSERDHGLADVRTDIENNRRRCVCEQDANVIDGVDAARLVTHGDPIGEHVLLAREDRAAFGLAVAWEDEFAVAGRSEVALRFGDEHLGMRAGEDLEARAPSKRLEHLVVRNPPVREVTAIGALEERHPRERGRLEVVALHIRDLDGLIPLARVQSPRDGAACLVSVEGAVSSTAEGSGGTPSMCELKTISSFVISASRSSTRTGYFRW